MKGEIKEIIDNIKKCCDIDKDENFVVYQKQDILKVLDYITNLQDKYEEADNDRHTLFERNEKAIEYINKNDDYFYNYPLINRNEVLNILQGGDEE